MNPKIDYIEEDGLVYEVRTYPDGSKYWCYKGELHRLTGPAIERPSGYNSYYINGEWFKTFEDYKEAIIQIKIKEILDLEIS